MSTDRKPFRERTFYYCYNCGYGECGVHDYGISFDQAREIIADRSGEETAANWESSEDGHFQFHVDYYMVDEYQFSDELWEGSDDY